MRTILLAGLLMSSILSAQTPEEVSSIEQRIEAAWTTNTNQAFEALYCKTDADQTQIDSKVAGWIGNRAFKKESKIRTVRFLSKSDLEKLADPKNGDVNAARYQEYLDGITKPVLMNGNSYIQNIPVVGLLELEISYLPRGSLTRFVSVGRSKDGKLLLTTLKRG
ncbi:MAG: hypothetical protein NTW21_00095 [Verrucomicrobia bacterium]|nr:hypothetical protein [Verrucomicrobiota bacterium]